MNVTNVNEINQHGILTQHCTTSEVPVWIFSVSIDLLFAGGDLDTLSTATLASAEKRFGHSFLRKAGNGRSSESCNSRHD
jgi:hypothetical protein